MMHLKRIPVILFLKQIKQIAKPVTSKMHREANIVQYTTFIDVIQRFIHLLIHGRGSEQTKNSGVSHNLYLLLLASLFWKRRI